MRYAADFVVMMKGRDVALEAFIEEKLEVWMGLKLNREKTRVVELREAGASLEFLGCLFRWDRDLLAREWGYWNRSPSAKSVGRERERLRKMTSVSQSHVPLALGAVKKPRIALRSPEGATCRTPTALITRKLFVGA